MKLKDIADINLDDSDNTNILFLILEMLNA